MATAPPRRHRRPRRAHRAQRRPGARPARARPGAGAPGDGRRPPSVRRAAGRARPRRPCCWSRATSTASTTPRRCWRARRRGASPRPSSGPARWSPRSSPARCAPAPSTGRTSAGSCSASRRSVLLALTGGNPENPTLDLPCRARVRARPEGREGDRAGGGRRRGDHRAAPALLALDVAASPAHSSGKRSRQRATRRGSSSTRRTAGVMRGATAWKRSRHGPKRETTADVEIEHAEPLAEQVGRRRDLAVHVRPAGGDALVHRIDDRVARAGGAPMRRTSGLIQCSA